MSMNEDLVRELKVAHYKFTWFVKGARTRLGMVEALVAIARFLVGTQIEGPKAP